MDYATIAGLIVGFAAITIAAAAGQGAGVFLDSMSAVLVLGGTVAATLVNFPLHQIKNALIDLKEVFHNDNELAADMAKQMVDMATRARRQGILILEDDLLEGGLADMPVGLMRSAVSKVVDGATSELLRAALETELSIHEDKKAASRAVFTALGAYAPAFGMIGTLVGLVQMCNSLDDPEKLGPALALALVTTFYGAVLANLVFLPIAGKIKALSDRDVLIGSMVIEGMTAISSGANPRIVEQTLQMYVEGRIPAVTDRSVVAPTAEVGAQ